MSDVRIHYHHELEGWWADSPDLSGFIAAGETFDDVRDMARGSVYFATDTQPQIVEDNIPSRDPTDWRPRNADIV